eukprot:TRINITY_DN3682_c0_g1_i2.p1 TRINITY_DN3682_c0_g1~~TRINITY_DN3682_c0_g1_i2.p1  ORF type:complete len:135 (+),score=15.76 TRINITY_DN3682_c0_g1_i2:40-444(+)
MTNKPADPKRLQEATSFIEQVLGEKLPSPDFYESLKTGVILCKFLNKLKPGTIKNINTRNMPFMMMENIGYYIRGCQDIGIQPEYNFMTVDLWEQKNLGQVALNIISVKRHFGFGFEKNEEKSSSNYFTTKNFQ